MIWRRMAYFGDATAHASILGVALAVAGLMPLYLAVFLVALVMALVVSVLHDRGHTMDATLGVMAYGGLSLGLVAVSFTEQPDVELHDFLFGDILQVTAMDLSVIWGGALLVGGRPGLALVGAVDGNLERGFGGGLGVEATPRATVVDLGVGGGGRGGDQGGRGNVDRSDVDHSGGGGARAFSDP